MSGYQENNGLSPMPLDQPMQAGVYASDLERQSLSAASYYPAYNQPMFTSVDPSENPMYYNGAYGQAQYYPNSHSGQFVPPFSPMAAASGYGPSVPFQQPIQYESQNFNPVPNDMMQNQNNFPKNYEPNFGYNPHYQNNPRGQFRDRGRGNNNNNRGNRRGFKQQPPAPANLQYNERNSEFQNYPGYRGNFKGHKSYQAMSFQNRNRKYDNYDNSNGKYEEGYQPTNDKHQQQRNDRQHTSKPKDSTQSSGSNRNEEGAVGHSEKLTSQDSRLDSQVTSLRRHHDVPSKDPRYNQPENQRPTQSGFADGRDRRDKQPRNVSNDKYQPGNGNYFASKKEKGIVNVAAGPKNYNNKGTRPKYGGKWDHNQSADKDESQRGSLTEQLSSNAYECMVCCEAIKVESAIWSCDNCYHVFHLHCTKRWAHSSVDKDSNSWRCPGCQNESSNIPTQYRCFCGRRRDPRYIRGETPHSCGETCRKKRKGNCKHPCTILCHPGPCPPCSSMVNQPCDCGKQKKSVRCSVALPYKCDAICSKQLSCGEHKCVDVCHPGSCELCIVTKTIGCYCGKKERHVLCGTDEFEMVSYSCEGVCGRTLSCGNHLCEVACHPGECAPCSSDPAVLSTCCCGKTPLEKLNGMDRHSCLDPIPVCGQICNKSMACGPEDDHHLCDKKCHEGDCGPCNKETSVTCQCLRMEKDFPCETAIAFNENNPFKCQKRCGKKKTCGRHKCSDNCCVKDFHICEYICGMKLTCGIHKCKEICHRGNCKRCLETSFDELTCFCGATVLEPPIPCGTKAPECRELCPRKRECGHPVRHNCHVEDDCPPCTELTEITCMGGHTVRKNIPCHMKNISCGMPCKKELPCGIHQCLKVCHKGPCLSEGASCTQVCIKPRPACGHHCGAPCHAGDCPSTFCKTEIMITCRCGNRSTKMECQMGGDQSGEIAQFQRLTVHSFAESGGEGVDLAQFSQTKSGCRKLDCDTTCAVLERNKRVALALEIKNPDVSAKLGNPTFTDFLKDFGKKNSAFVLNVEKALGTLAQTAKNSLQPSRGHSFPSMNRDQRRFVHELAEFYGCETKSYDYEPNKNVVATAYRDKCWLPNVTLSQLLFKDQAKAPPPLSGLKTQGVTFTVLEKKKPTDESLVPRAPVPRAWESVRPSSKPAAKPGPKPSTAVKSAATPTVDYFDFTEK